MRPARVNIQLSTSLSFFSHSFTLHVCFYSLSLSLSLSLGYFFLPPSPISHFAGKLECCRILSYFLSTTDFDRRPLAKEANSPVGFEEIRRKVVDLFFGSEKNKTKTDFIQPPKWAKRYVGCEKENPVSCAARVRYRRCDITTLL